MIKVGIIWNLSLWQHILSAEVVGEFQQCLYSHLKNISVFYYCPDLEYGSYIARESILSISVQQPFYYIAINILGHF